MMSSRGRFVFNLGIQAHGGGNGFEIHQKMTAIAIFINISITYAGVACPPGKLMAAMRGCGTISRSF
jgi:hypothetical protein